MTNNDRAELTVNHELEVQQVVDLANVVGMYHNKHRVPDVIEEEDFFGEVSDQQRNRHPSVVPLGDLVSKLLAEGIDDEEVLCYLSDNSTCYPLLGIYLQVAVPVMNGSTYSWGHCRLQWVFGSTYEEAFKVACEWAKEQGYG